MLLVGGLLVAAVVVVLVVVPRLRDGAESAGSAPGATDITVTIDNESFALSDGVAEKPAAPDSAAPNSLRVVGEPVAGDITGDGRPDQALLVANNAGGSGTFYYAVLAVDDGGSYRATNVVPLGDRILPHGIEFRDGRFVYDFSERKPGEPMAASPSVETRVPIAYDPATGAISVAR